MGSTTAPFVQQLFAERIGGANYGKSTAIYKFEMIKRAKRAARQAKPEVSLIDMGVGEPDAPPFPEVIATLQQAAADPETRGYTDNGIPEFKEAAARYMQRVFGVELNAETQFCHSIGSKSALTLLPACYINPGDVTLMTVPGYGVFGTHAKYYGGEVVNLPLSAANDYLPQLHTLSAEQCRRAKVLVLNYPNNPTGAGATKAFFEAVIQFAHQHQVLVLHDAAYAGVMFPGEPALSILSIPGADEVALELHSLSKSYNMTGWRIGFVCGNELAVRAYADVKDNSDSGQFAAIQRAGSYCLDHPEISAAIASKYSRRMDLLIPILQKHGFHAKKPVGGFFLYVRAPKAAQLVTGQQIAFPTAADFSQFLISEQLISTVPWDDVEPSVRWSVTFAAPTLDAEQEVVAEIDRRLGQMKFQFAD